jgi:hypothetical protein
VVNGVEPPVEAVPLTTRNAELSLVVNFVQPTGAAAWQKILIVPDGIDGLGITVEYL